MSDRLSTQEQGRRTALLRKDRALTQEMLAELVGVDVGTVARWEKGNHEIRARNLAALATALQVDVRQLETPEAPPGPNGTEETSHRDLQRVEFVAWLAEASGKTFDETYQAVVRFADRREAESGSKRHARNYDRGGVSRQDLAQAVADYYDLPNDDQRLYTANVAGEDLTLSILSDPSWTGCNIDLQSDNEHASVVPSPGTAGESFSSALFNAGVARLADAEVNNKVLMNNPMYRLLSLDIDAQSLRPTFALAEFADYALRNGLMEVELIDVIARSDTQQPPGT